jgi:hypothetical protein
VRKKTVILTFTGRLPLPDSVVRSLPPLRMSNTKGRSWRPTSGHRAARIGLTAPFTTTSKDLVALFTLASVRIQGRAGRGVWDRTD